MPVARPMQPPHRKGTDSLSGEEIGKLCRPAGSWTSEKKVGKLWEVGGGGPPGCWLVRRDERPQGKKLERWWGAKNLDENGLFSSASEEKRRVSSTFLLLERLCWRQWLLGLPVGDCQLLLT